MTHVASLPSDALATVRSVLARHAGEPGAAAAGRTVVQVCRAESCQACGADALMAHAEEVLGCKSHHTRADGAYTLEPVYCLGMCAVSPAIMVGDKLHARVTPEKFDRIVGALA